MEVMQRMFSKGHVEEVVGGAARGQVCLHRGGFAMVRVCRGRGLFGLKQSFRSLYNELPHLNWFETIIRVPLQSTILVVHVICTDFQLAPLQHYVFLVGGFEMYLIALALQITILLCCRIHSIIVNNISWVICSLRFYII